MLPKVNFEERSLYTLIIIFLLDCFIFIGIVLRETKHVKIESNKGDG
jgi:hypothetical protein